MIALPARNDVVMRQVLWPALVRLPQAMRSVRAQVVLLAIGRHESGFALRAQVRGPARGLWQFERNGVLGVLQHAATKDAAVKACLAAGAEPRVDAVYAQLAEDDGLACVFARLLLWADPQPLPALGDASGAWSVYLRTWNPGARDVRVRFNSAYHEALECIP